MASVAFRLNVVATASCRPANRISIDVRFCEGLQTPDVTNIATPAAAGVWKPPLDETAGKGTYEAVPARYYGDLAAGGLQLS